MNIEININTLYFIIGIIKIISYYITILIISFISIYLITHKFNITTILYTIILFSLLIIILNTYGNNLLNISVSSAINPVPTNIGLNGISKLNLLAGMKI